MMSNMKKIRYLLIVGMIFVIVLVMLLKIRRPMQQSTISNTTIRYVALGDSYTIGEGATPDEAWPSVLTKHLRSEGADIALIANPSVTGWTTEQVITNELGVYDAAQPTFATLLIGVNDWVQGVDTNSFHKNLITILDHMQEKLPKKNNLLLITIPDFGVTPTGAKYSGGRDISRGIAEFNTVIIEEAKKRNLPVVDIYPLTQQMKQNTNLIALDGLHPSGSEYALWEKEIFPIAKKMLGK
jgi:lysophospholipase L1-like esterase